MHRSNMRGIICAKTGLGKAHYIDSFAGMMSSLRKIAGKLWRNIFFVWWITIVVGGIKFEVAFICF